MPVGQQQNRTPQGTPGPPPGPIFSGGGGGGEGTTAPQPPQTTEGSTPSLFDQLIFGSSGGESGFVGPGSLPTTSVTQQESLNSLLNLMGQLLSGSSLAGGFQSGAELFGGQVPGMSDLSAMSLEGLQRIANGELNVFSGAPGAQSIQTLMEMLSAPGQDTTQLFNQTVAGPAQEDLARALETINLNAVGSGNLFGSERGQVIGDTTDDFFDSLEGQRQQFAFNSEEASRNRALEALGLAPSVLGLDSSIGQGLLKAGETERLAQMQQFMTEVGLFEADRQRETQLLEMLLTGSVAPTFGVSGGFSIPNTAGSSGGLLDSFIGSFFPKKN